MVYPNRVDIYDVEIIPGAQQIFSQARRRIAVATMGNKNLFIAGGERIFSQISQAMSLTFYDFRIPDFGHADTYPLLLSSSLERRSDNVSVVQIWVTKS